MHRILLPLLALMPSAALAHPGQLVGAPFMAGLTHPLGGADHLMAMFAIGVLAAGRGRRIVWAVPAAFLAAMVGGGALGAAGVPLPGVEPMILASVIVLGGIAALALRPSNWALVAMAAVFGLFHGHAHGTEANGAALLPFAAGFVLASATLHLAGIALSLSARQAGRVAGVATIAGGLFLAFA